MLIVPGYIEVLDNKREIILKSQLHGNIIQLNEEIYIEEFRKIQKEGTENNSTELVKFLYEEEMLATKEDIYKNIELVYSALDAQLQITIMPTEKCNFKCTYCYENFKNGKMSELLINKIKQFIHKKISTEIYESLYIVWFGGEPTLCRDIVLDLNHYAKGLCDEYNVRFKSSMTTNGYLLDSDRLISFYDVGISVYQITIDGFRHDRSRVLLDGSKTLEKLLGNLKEIRQLPQGFKFKVIIRYNILEKDEDLLWYDTLKDLFNDDKRFSVLIRVVSDFGGERVKELDIIDTDSYRDVVKEHSNYARDKGLTVENDSMANPFASVCYAALKNSYIFRSNGKIVKCSLDLDVEKNLIGNTENQVCIDTKKNEVWYKSSISDKCLQCSYILACLNKNCPRKSDQKECMRWGA